MSRSAIALGLGLLAASLGGCKWPGGDDSQGVHITAQLPPSQGTDLDLYHIRVYLITAEFDAEQPAPDFWRFLDETQVGLSHRRLLAANGLRIAVGGRLAVEWLNETIDASEQLGSRLISTVKATPGQVLDVPLGVSMQDCTVFSADADGTVWGREFPGAATMVRIHCRAADRPNHTEVSIAQEIVYGDPQPKHVPAGRSQVMTMEPPRYRFADLESRIVIREGDLVAVGLMPGRWQSIGEQLFAAPGAAGRRSVTTLLVQPVLLRPGQSVQDSPAPTVP